MTCFSFTSLIVNVLPERAFARATASAFERRMTLEFALYFPLSLSKSLPLATRFVSTESIDAAKPSAKTALRSQYSDFLNVSLVRSLSTTSLRPGDWTRPALRLLLESFDQRTGEIV